MSSAYVHAALLLHFAKQPINEENLKKVIEAAGITADVARIRALATAISEVNIDEAIKTAPLGVTLQAPAAPTPGEAPKPEEKAKKEEKEKPKKEEEALAGLGALFG